MNHAALIGLDWGSTSLRAMLIDGEGRVLEQRLSGKGASVLGGGPAEFGAVLDSLIADWREAALPVWGCGMVGSQHGWREVPYADCPADPATLAAGSLAVDWSGWPVRLLPGLRCRADGVPDIMRGEETQVVGAVALDPTLGERTCFVLPGTHSKWAEVVDGKVQTFCTHMTGELFALLRKHSVLGKLMRERAADDADGFGAGVRAARDDADTGLGHQLFSVRTLALMNDLPHQALAGYLSGLLIGHELRAGLRWREGRGLKACRLVLIGEEPLTARYRQALDLFDAGPSLRLPNTAGAGLFRLAGGL